MSSWRNTPSDRGHVNITCEQPPLLIPTGLPYVPIPTHHLHLSKATRPTVKTLPFYPSKILNQKRGEGRNGHPEITQMSKYSKGGKKTHIVQHLAQDPCTKHFIFIICTHGSQMSCQLHFADTKIRTDIILKICPPFHSLQVAEPGFKSKMPTFKTIKPMRLFQRL